MKRTTTTFLVLSYHSPQGKEPPLSSLMLLAGGRSSPPHPPARAATRWQRSLPHDPLQRHWWASYLARKTPGAEQQRRYSPPHLPPGLGTRRMRSSVFGWWRTGASTWSFWLTGSEEFSVQKCLHWQSKAKNLLATNFLRLILTKQAIFVSRPI